MTMDVFLTDSRPDALTKNLSVVRSGIPIVNKQGIDLLTPDIIVEYDASLLQANYFYVPTFGRYYFYRKPPAILTGGRMCIFGTVDVLTSFADGIRNVNALIIRQSKPTDVKDTKFPLAPGSWVESIKLPSPFTDNGTFRYVVGINGAYTIAGGE